MVTAPRWNSPKNNRKSQVIMSKCVFHVNGEISRQHPERGTGREKNGGCDPETVFPLPCSQILLLFPPEISDG
jgi:hypothetical protein